MRWTALYFKLRRIYLSIKTDPNRYSYSDTAMTAVAADEAETHELFNSDAARAYVAQSKRVKQMQEGQGHDHGFGVDHTLVPGHATVSAAAPVRAAE